MFLVTAPIMSGRELRSALLDALDEVHIAYPVRDPQHVGYGKLARRLLDFYGAMLLCARALRARTDTKGREGLSVAIYYGISLTSILLDDFLPGGPPRKRPALQWTPREQVAWMPTLIRDHRNARTRWPAPPAWLEQFAAPLRTWLAEGHGT